jgi:hypothetical protein
MVVDACLGGVRRTVPGGATLDLNFMSAPLDPRITFTRASTATYTDASGVIQTAATNAPRWDYAGGVLRGLLIEEARTNNVHFSGDASNASWTASSTTTLPVRVANAITAPDGTLTAASIAFPAVSGAGQACVITPIQLSGTVAPYVYSVWLRGTVGGERVYLNTTLDAVLYYRTQAVLTTAWQRFILITPNLTAVTWYFQLGADLRDAGQTATSAQTVYVWGAQVEQGASVSSYIPTAAVAVTRSADLASMSFTPAASGTYQAEFIPAGAAAALPVIISGNAGSPVMVIGADSRLVASIRSGASVFSAIAPSMTFNVVNKAAFGWLTGASKAAVNGTLLGANAVALTVTGTSIEFGSDGVTPGNNALNGWLRGVRYWPRQLSDVELQAVTT